jgi:hypothetical protein
VLDLEFIRVNRLAVASRILRTAQLSLQKRLPNRSLPQITLKQRSPTTRVASWPNSASAAWFQTVMCPDWSLANAATAVLVKSSRGSKVDREEGVLRGIFYRLCGPLGSRLVSLQLGVIQVNFDAIGSQGRSVRRSRVSSVCRKRAGFQPFFGRLIPGSDCHAGAGRGLQIRRRVWRHSLGGFDSRPLPPLRLRRRPLPFLARASPAQRRSTGASMSWGVSP